MAEWISVKDRLPQKKDEAVLVYAPDWGVDYCHYNARLCEWEFWDDLITHWMPAPEPPQEVSE